MKFCKDCIHHTPEISGHGGTLLPGFFFYLPAQCKKGEHVEVDLVDGREIRSGGHECTTAREESTLCGPDAHWFEPATLDGRLAMLPEA